MMRAIKTPIPLRITLATGKIGGTAFLVLLLAATLAGFPQAKDPKEKPSKEPLVGKLRIEVTAEKGQPVGNASVYIRYPEEHHLLRRSTQVEMNFKTNQDGSVKVPEVRLGKILIQVVVPGWKTYGKWYILEKDDETIQIKLEKPPHWY
jgi:hypothetical protein